MYYYYCPVCSFIYENPVDECKKCNTTVPIKRSIHPKDYYETKYDSNPINYDDEEDVLFEEEIDHNPDLNVELCREVFDEKDKDDEDNIWFSQPTTNQQQQQYTPKCPVCQSPNINKISGLSRAVHGLTFGLFSKTARSQWVCNSCGNKW